MPLRATHTLGAKLVIIGLGLAAQLRDAAPGPHPCSRASLGHLRGTTPTKALLQLSATPTPTKALLQLSATPTQALLGHGAPLMAPNHASAEHWVCSGFACAHLGLTQTPRQSVCHDGSGTLEGVSGRPPLPLPISSQSSWTFESSAWAS